MLVVLGDQRSSVGLQLLLASHGTIAQVQRVDVVTGGTSYPFEIGMMTEY